MAEETSKRLELVCGVLEYLVEVCKKCRDEYAAIQHKYPCGLLDKFDPAFGILKKTRRQSNRQYYSTSNATIGIEVHAQLELAAKGHEIVNPHPFATAIAERIREKEWIAVGGEVPIVHAAANMFTKADMLVYDKKTNRPILLEFKTGLDTGYRAKLISRWAHINIPGVDIYDSPQTRAHLQLAWMYWALKLKYALPRLEAYIIISNASGAKKPEKLAAWAEKNAQYIYECVADACSKSPASATSITSN